MDIDTRRAPAATAPAGATAGSPAQLRLLEAAERPEWLLDETTREVGRRGIEQARQALRSARRLPTDRPAHHDGPGQRSTAA